MLRVVADTNIYISALNFDGIPDQVLELARRGRLELFICAPILDEVAGVLQRKFGWPPRRAQQALAAIRVFATGVEPRERVHVVRKDESDNRILECAIAARATVIVTGDSHLRDLGSFRSIRILSPSAFLKTVCALS